MKLQAKEREESRSTSDLRSSPNTDAAVACLWGHPAEKAARVASHHPADFPRYVYSPNSNTRHQALWQHAVASQAVPPTSPLQFEVRQCTEEKVPVDGIAGTPPSLLKQARKRKYQKSGRPRDWRTRADPDVRLWDQITAWLTAQPERTGVDIFQELQRLSPGRFRPTQVRTLQRGLQKIRARLLVTFDDQWGEELVNGQAPAPELRAELVGG
jgi:hypothetical protein